MGGARIALPSDNVTVGASPGMVGLHERFDIHASGAVGPGRGLHWAATAVDARTSDFLAIGIAYAGDRYHPEFRASELPGWTPTDIEPTNVKRYHDLALAAGVPLLGRRVCIGIGGNWSFYNHDSQGSGSTGNIDAGLGLRPLDDLSLAFSAEHLLPIDPTGDRPFTLGAGASYGSTGPVIATSELRWTDGADTPWGVAGGLDVRAGSGRLRAGASFDGAAVGPTTWASWGLAIANEDSELGYSMQVPFGAGSETATSLIHTLGVQFTAPRTDSM